MGGPRRCLHCRYPLFVPDHLPLGLVPRMPKLQPDETWGKQLWIEYVPPEEVEQDSFPQLQITEYRATYQAIANWTEGATPVHMASGKG
jgi:hypothetical protein